MFDPQLLLLQVNIKLLAIVAMADEVTQLLLTIEPMIVIRSTNVNMFLKGLDLG